MTGKPLISFDYAIKYLLKDKGDYEIVEGFISALLKSQGYKDVKIVALLDAESNKEDKKSKRSLADLIVKDEDNQQYIIEIDRNLQQSFIHKALFNTSRLIVDNLAQRTDFASIVKIFHISILYFPVGKGAIHHGQTIIRDIESNERLTVHIKDPETKEVIHATDIMPEYFFISIPLFNDRLEREIDDWLYVMKHDAVPENFHSPYMKKVAEKLSILKMTPTERDDYYYYMKKVYVDSDELFCATQKGLEEGLEKGRKEGIEQGREEGKEEGIRDIARMMFREGIDIQKISKVTGFSEDEIKSL